MRKLSGISAVLLLICSFSSAQAPLPDSPELEQKVNTILSKMTLEQKIDMIGGVNKFDIRAYPDLGLPEVHMADGPIGVRNDGPATVMAGGVALASTWDPALAQRVGEQIARDARAKGKHFVLGPGVNICRAPMNGRNFEYFGEDPFLGSRIAVGYIEGVQSQGVAATIKHFMGNNSEFDRHSTDSIIGERALHEIYLPIFEAAVKEAHVAAVMDSYNLTNGEHMTQNGGLNNEVLKKEWGFQGILMSDWDATYDAVAAANGGLDLEMPSGRFFNREKLLPAVKEGKVSEETINDKVRRIIRTELEFQWAGHERQDLSIPRYNRQGDQVALQAAREGMVLLKNDSNALPLDKNKTRTIAVIGPDAYPAVPVGGGSAQVTAFRPIGFMLGLSNYLRDSANVTYANGLMTFRQAAEKTNFVQSSDRGAAAGIKLELFDNETLSGTPTASEVVQHVNSGATFENPSADDEIDWTGTLNSRGQRWSSYFVAATTGSFAIFVQQGGWGSSGFRMYVDDKLLFDNWANQKFIVAQTRLELSDGPHKIVLEHHNTADNRPPLVRLGIIAPHDWVDPVAEQLAAKADAVVLAVGFSPVTETEGWDRTFELPPGQTELIQRIAAKNKNTIVVVTSGGSVDMLPWIDKVPGVIEAWYPGQEGGTALAEILFGDVNPSGHLADTFELRLEDNPAYANYYPAAGTNKILYKEAIFVGYRGYEHNAVKPLFAFGYGLSYTTFQYSNLTADEHGVSFDVTNTGSRAGDAVAQVYIARNWMPGPQETHIPKAANTGRTLAADAANPRPPKELKGFSRVALKPGETKPVNIPLNVRSFAYYDEKAKNWRALMGTYDVLVGGSSAQIELTGKITLPHDETEKP